MYLGYQKNEEGQEFIAAIASTKKELENMPCIKFERISATKKEYVFYEGQYITKQEAKAIEEEKRKKEEKDALYAELDRLDAKAIRSMRALQSGQGTEEDTKYLQAIEDRAEELRKQISKLSAS